MVLIRGAVCIYARVRESPPLLGVASEDMSSCGMPWLL